MIKLIFKSGIELNFDHIGTNNTFTYEKQIGLRNLTTIHMRKTTFSLQSESEHDKIYIEEKTEDYDFKIKSVKKFNPLTYKMEKKHEDVYGNFSYHDY